MVINKSTVPVGSTVHVDHLLRQAGAVADVGVASNPEFLREGTAVRDFLHPSRVVVGADDAAVAVRVTDLYKGVQAPIVVTDSVSAEMVKYASNAFLATKVSFVNEIANICELVHADVRDVVLGMGYDPRIGFEFLHPGPGWGGSCFPKDTAALVHTAEVAGYDFGLLRAAISGNQAHQAQMVEKLRDACGGRSTVHASLRGGSRSRPTPTTCASRRRSRSWGRSSSTVRTCARTTPRAGETATAIVPELEVVSDPYAACVDAQVLTVLTEWDEFRWLDYERVAEVMRTPTIVDTRNLLDPAALRRLGFVYRGVGR